MGLISSIRRKLKSVSRYNQILGVLLKYGFENLVFYLEEKKKYPWLHRLIPKARYKHALQYSQWEKMRLVCEELGPTFVKFGQILSNRPDLIPFDLVFELEKLQDSVPPMPVEIAKEVVEEELKDTVENLFAWFEPEPFASASMAQVHNVTLLNGKRVAMKVQRKGIQKVILEDIKVMYSIADVLEHRIPSLKSFDPVGLVKNFEESILKELDFIHESINIQRFYNHIKLDDSAEQFANAPAVYPKYTTGKVLAMEFMSGIKINALEEIEEKGYDKIVLARRLTISYFKQIFEYGFFHADPHPGNLIIEPNQHICYLDFGMMGSILPRDIEIFGRLFLAITQKDVNKIIRALQQLSNNMAIDNMRALEFDVNEFVEKYYVRSVEDNEMSTILLDLRDIIIEHDLVVPTHFYLFIRSLVTIEGVIDKLDPDLDQFEIVKPYLIRSVSRSYNPIKMGEKALNAMYELGNYMEELPRDIKNVIRKINSGMVKVDLTHQGIDPMVHTINRVTKQIIGAFIMVALIVGATMFIIYKVEPLWKGFSAIGVMAIILAFIIAFFMIRDIRKGDHDTDIW